MSEATPPSEERWLPIEGFDGRYDISSHGRVRTWIKRVGSRVDPLTEPAIRVTGKGGTFGQYRVIVLIGERDKKPRTRYVHRLVALHFIGPCPPRHEVAHDDGVGHHNWVENLSWKTRKDNHADKKRHGTEYIGERHHRCKLTSAQVMEIRAAAGKTSGPKLAKKYGVGHETIYAILNGKTWKHLLEKTS